MVLPAKRPSHGRKRKKFLKGETRHLVDEPRGGGSGINREKSRLQGSHELTPPIKKDLAPLCNARIRKKESVRGTAGGKCRRHFTGFKSPSRDIYREGRRGVHGEREVADQRSGGCEDLSSKIVGGSRAGIVRGEGETGGEEEKA